LLHLLGRALKDAGDCDAYRVMTTVRRSRAMIRKC
jgi:hypothetical protein